MKVNGEDFKIIMVDGYAVIRKKWKKGDVINLSLPMPARRLVADPRVEADNNRFAIQRGPLMFCAEWPDNEGNKVLNLVFDPEASIDPSYQENILDGTIVLATTAKQAGRTVDGEISLGETQEAVLIPYHLWNNRGPGEMEVWLPDTVTAARPEPAPTIAR